MDTGKILTRYRKLAGLSQTDVANVIGFHRSALAKIEVGNREITLSEFFKILEVIDLPYMDFYLTYKGLKDLPILPNKQKISMLSRKEAKLKSQLERIQSELNNIKEARDEQD